MGLRKIAEVLKSAAHYAGVHTTAPQWVKEDMQEVLGSMNVHELADEIVRAKQERDAEWLAAIDEMLSNLQELPQHQMAEYERDRADGAIDALEELKTRMAAGAAE